MCLSQIRGRGEAQRPGAHRLGRIREHAAHDPARAVARRHEAANGRRRDPGESPLYAVELDFAGAPIGSARAAFRPLDEDFVSAIAPARSFALLEEVAALCAQGLARGGSLENALVIGPDGPLNPEGMRFADEPARHKLLDAIGDLSILGGLPWARVSLARPSHALNRALVARAAAGAA